MVDYKIIATGSKGNAVIYDKRVLVDVGTGVAMYKLEPYLPDIELILLTHEHKDHIDISKMGKIADKYPDILFVAGEHLEEHLKNALIKNYLIVEAGKVYKHKNYKLSPVVLYHDVPNFGYRIFTPNKKKIFHATDTSTLSGISAIGYDLYGVENNYTQEALDAALERMRLGGGYEYILNSKDRHLSDEKVKAWLDVNNTKGGKVIWLHESSTYGREATKAING